MRDPSRVALACAASLFLGFFAVGQAPALAQSTSADQPALPDIPDLTGLPADPAADDALPDPSLPTDIATDSDPLPTPLSATVDRLDHWVLASGDNHGLPYLIIDKPDAEVFAFDAQGMALGEAPALLGIAKGDDTAPGVGDIALGKIPMDERTTPAGRFVAYIGPASDMKDVLWVDYDSALSLHPVITSNPKERRLQRLHSSSLAERRISHGCINVPARFYEDVVRPAFNGSHGIVYIVPDTKPMDEVFPQLGIQALGDTRAPHDELTGLDFRHSVEATLGPEVPDPGPAAVQ
jgi:hypothetical protein